MRTYGGEFMTEFFRVTPGSSGVEIKLVFKPDAPTVSPKIALMQTAKTTRNRKREFDDGKLNIPNRSLDDGTHIDSTDSNDSPLYATQPQGPGGQLKDSTPKRFEKKKKEGGEEKPKDDEIQSHPSVPTETARDSGSGFGKRVSDGGMGFTVECAWLYDGPEWDFGKDEGAQELETAALCVDGDMAGVYLGTVQWGYRRTYDDRTERATLTPIDPHVTSMGVPPETWMKAAGKWNTTGVREQTGVVEDEWEDTPTFAEHAPVQIPLTDHGTGDKVPPKELIPERILVLTQKLEHADPVTRKNLLHEIESLKLLL